VDERVAGAFGGEGRATEEVEVLGRELAVAARVVGRQRGPAAVDPPQLGVADALGVVEHHLVVVAAEEDAVRARLRHRGRLQLQHPVEDGRALRAAVHVVPDEDERVTRAERAAGGIRQPIEERVERPCAAVDVPDGVQSHS